MEKKETPTPPPVSQEKVSKAEDLEAPVVFPEAEEAEPSFPHISKKHKIEVEPVEKKETPTPPPVFQEKVSKAEDLEAPVVFPDRPFYEERSRPLDRQDESVFERQSLRSKFIPSGERSGSPGAASESAPVSRESIEKIIREVEGIHAILKSMQASVSAMSNEMKALSEIRKSLGETNSYLRNFRDLFARTKKGKRWFKF